MYPKQRYALVSLGLLMVVWIVLLSVSQNVAQAAGPFPKGTGTLRAFSFQGMALAASPDLVIEKIEYEPAIIQVGTGANLTVTVKNQGDSMAAGFYVYMYVDPLQQPPNSTTAYTTRTFWGVPLAPGETFRWTRTQQIFNQNGVYPVYAWVDRDNQVAETNENNNLGGPVYITVGETGDAFEPDNLCSQAHWILTDGAEQTHHLNPIPDVDWVKFNGVNGVTYRIQGIADGADADLELALMAECGGPPSYGGGTGQDFTYTVVTDGIYYLKIQHLKEAYGPNNAYRLRITEQDHCTRYFEPNSSCSTSGDIGVDQAAQVHTFCQANDADWTSFQAEAGASYIVEAKNIGARANAQVQLYASCASDELKNGPKIEITTSQTQKFYIKAHPLDGQIYGNDTEYSLRVTKISACAPDTFENDDAVSTAQTIPVDGLAQTHTICPAGDADWGSFRAIADTTYTLETSNLGNHADTLLCLYDATGSQLIRCDDDGGPGLGSRLVWKAPDNGVYTVKTDHQQPNQAGPATQYDLRIYTGLCTSDYFEPDNTQNSAQRIAVNGSVQRHSVCPAKDMDWVKFTAAPGPYLIETNNLGLEADPVLELYDANGARLAANDDFADGAAARISYIFSDSQTYFIKISHFNPVAYGAGTEYSLKVTAGSPTATPPTPTPYPTLTPTPTPPPSQVKTILLVNPAQIERLYNSTRAGQLLSKVQALAAHSTVRGEVIRLDRNEMVSAMYADWNADSTNVEKANLVAAAIRQVIMTYLRQHSGVEYIVLVGDDQALPFRRIPDRTPDNPQERLYLRVSKNHPTGAALHANYFLTDNYYADLEPTAFEGRELYLPDLAIGRILETPENMIAIIDTYLEKQTLTVSKVLVTGYDFVQDGAQVTCDAWKSASGSNAVDCSLIGDAWLAADFKNKQLGADPFYNVQSISGHADHSQEGVPIKDQSAITATDILISAADLSRALIYTIGCHAGLNVPDSDTGYPLDLAQVFLYKKANYVANTGYGWGNKGTIGLQEELMHLYTHQLLNDSQSSIGKALAAAKRQYYSQTTKPNGYDEKILEEWTFYGLPMYQMITGSVLGPGDDPFPSVQIATDLSGSLGSTGVISQIFNVALKSTLPPSQSMAQVTTQDGDYFSLDRHQYAVTGEPLQPLFFAKINISGLPARSLVWLSGKFESIFNFKPLIAAPINEYASPAPNQELQPANWYPAVPASLQLLAGKENLVSQFGQFNPGGQELRLFKDLQVEVYYSNSSDQTPPEVQSIGSRYNPLTRRVEIKVSANDAAGIQRVLITYTRGDGRWQSIDAAPGPTSQNWQAQLPAGGALRFLVQVVDRGGNVTTAANKGQYYTPDGLQFANYGFFLPLLKR